MFGYFEASDEHVTRQQRKSDRAGPREGVSADEEADEKSRGHDKSKKPELPRGHRGDAAPHAPMLAIGQQRIGEKKRAITDKLREPLRRCEHAHGLPRSASRQDLIKQKRRASDR